jgi:hypothetical protein
MVMEEKRKMRKIIVISPILPTLLLVSLILSSSIKAANLQFELRSLIETSAFDEYPYVLQDSTNKIWVFFASDGTDGVRHIYYITSVDGGATWTDQALFLPAFVPEQYAFYPVAFQDSTGKFWVAWLNHTAPHNADQIWFTASNDGETWTLPKLICNNHNDIGGFIETDGKIWFFFSPLSSYWRASYKTTDDGGNTWSDLVPITTDSGMRTPHATVLSNGTIFVVYRAGAYHFEANIGYSASSDGGSTWTIGVVDDPAYPEWDGNPRVIEHNENIYVLFNRGYEQTGNGEDIWFRVWNITKWENPQQVTNSSISEHPCPIFINNGLWVAYQTYNGDIWIAVSSTTTPPPPPPPGQISIELSGGHDYLPWENVKVKVAALAADVNTMEPISGANVTITIYDPENSLWINDTMTEKLNTGVYIWESTETVREIFRDYGKGVYVVYGEASLNNGPTASDILTFHIDPPPEDKNNQLPTIIGISLAAIAIIASAAIFIKKKRKL